ncbi:MAG: PbsX family transcriptional regulator [Candidatus Accumulibacter sp.]|jgi:antitoxin ChpS|nr:PbsX family transcriptional regulator [Accumulibacter sp.]
MRLNIQKWGNSAAVRLPGSVLAQMGAKIGDAFEADIEDRQVVLRVAKPRYRLADLLARCDPDAPAPDLGAWDDAKPAGREIW